MEIPTGCESTILFKQTPIPVPVTPEFNMPDVIIEMKNVAFWQPCGRNLQTGNSPQPDPITPAEMNRTLDTNDYDGNPTYWFEVIGDNYGEQIGGVIYPATEDYSVYLVDTNGNEYATITFEPNTPVPPPPYSNWAILQRKRVQFTPPEGETTFAVKIDPILYEDGNPIPPIPLNTPILGAIRIIIKQDESTTKSMIQIPMQCLGDWGVPDFYLNNNSFSKDFYTGSEGDYAHLPTYDDVLTSEYTNYNYQAGKWEYDSDELASISKALFEAVGGSPPQLLAGTGSEITWFWDPAHFGNPPTLSPVLSWGICLIDSNGELVPNSLVTGSYDEMVDYTAQLPLTLGTYTIWTTIDGGDTWIQGRNNYNNSIISWTIDHEPYRGTITWSVSKNPWATTPFNIVGLWFRFQWIYSTGTSPDSLYISLFDATTNTMVPGTELIWGPNSDVSRQQIEFDPTDLVSGHEYEMRWKIPDDGGIGIMIGFECNLYLWIDPISALTVWQRVACSEYNDYAGIDPTDNNDESRVLLNAPAGAECFFENVAKIWEGYTPPDIDPLLYQLVDVGTTDFGRTGTVVPDSQLTWIGNETPETRIRKKSGLLTLTDGNQFLTNEANNEDWLFQVQAFIIVGVKK